MGIQPGEAAPAARGLPMTTSSAPVEAQPANRGASVTALTIALAPVRSPTETARVAALLDRPVTSVEIFQAHRWVPGVPAAVSALPDLASAPAQRVHEPRDGGRARHERGAA